MGFGTAFFDQLDSVGDWGLLVTDTNLIITGWNRWLQQRSKLTAGDVLGRPLFEVFPDLVSRRLDRYYRQALSGQTVILSQQLHQYIIPLAMEGADTGREWMQQTGRIVPQVDGTTVTGTLTIIEDVTERILHEAELRARASQQAAVAKLARSALSGSDVSDLAREVVDHLASTLRVDFTEILELQPNGGSWALLAGTGWQQPVKSFFEEAAAPRIRSSLKSDTVVSAEDVAVDPKFASDPYLQSHGVVSAMVVRVPGRDDRAFGLVGAFSRTRRRFRPHELQFVQALADVLGVAGERKRLEDELRIRAGELADADRRKDEFLAMLAHELRNPLAPVRNALHVLRMKCVGDPLVERLGEMMTRQVGQLTRLVDDLLDVSRITRGKVDLRKEQVQLETVVARAVEAARPLIDARGHEVTVLLPPNPVYLNADPTRLVQVLGNLLNNAAKYTEEGGRIWLTVSREESEAVVSVRDTGIGIPPHMLPKVFDLFTQDDRTLDRAEGGIGIGLTLVRSLVELHGGSVLATSAGPGRGSEFVVRLPALSYDPRRKATDEDADQTPSAPPCRVLIVDDNVDSAESLAMLLSLNGHSVRTAHDGPSAIQAARLHRPDVILLDIGLPRMDGYEVARRLRQEPDIAAVLLLAMTGYGQEEDRRKTREAGFDLHFVKPVDADELTRVFARLGEAASSR